MLVVGGSTSTGPGWLRRARAMQRSRRPVVLFSTAATQYIKSGAAGQGAVTTHWRDIEILHETGHFPGLTHNLGEVASGIMTCAGQAYTAEAVIRLVSVLMKSQENAELTSMLQLESVRNR